MAGQVGTHNTSKHTSQPGTSRHMPQPGEPRCGRGDGSTCCQSWQASSEGSAGADAGARGRGRVASSAEGGGGPGGRRAASRRQTAARATHLAMAQTRWMRVAAGVGRLPGVAEVVEVVEVAATVATDAMVVADGGGKEAQCLAPAAGCGCAACMRNGPPEPRPTPADACQSVTQPGTGAVCRSGPILPLGWCGRARRTCECTTVPQCQGRVGWGPAAG